MGLVKCFQVLELNSKLLRQTFLAMERNVLIMCFHILATKTSACGEMAVMGGCAIITRNESTIWLS